MTTRASKDKTRITRIWIGRAQDDTEAPVDDGAETPEARALLDRVVAWTSDYLREHGLEVRSGHDGSLRTLDFETETDCLDAHERLVAANDRQRDFRFRFVLRPSGVTILVVS
jgi:hypothetical protein